MNYESPPRARKGSAGETKQRKVGKGAWRMPWLTLAMKDVISCEKLRGDANDL